MRLAQANLQTFRDAVQNLDLAYQQALRALETLAGRYPAAAVAVRPELAPAPAPVPVGMPSELLERRPDVVAAERRVAAAFYRIEEAKAARLPRISLTAAVTSISSELFVLKERDNPVWSAGASLIAPLFLGGQLQAQVEIRTAEQKQAVAEYGRIGARAFGEVENALSAGFALDAREAILREAVAENERALELANIRYRVGSGDLRAVLQQSLALYAAQVRCCACRASGWCSASTCTSRSAAASTSGRPSRHRANRSRRPRASRASERCASGRGASMIKLILCALGLTAITVIIHGVGAVASGRRVIGSGPGTVIDRAGSARSSSWPSSWARCCSCISPTRWCGRSSSCWSARCPTSRRPPTSRSRATRPSAMATSCCPSRGVCSVRSRRRWAC